MADKKPPTQPNKDSSHSEMQAQLKELMEWKNNLSNQADFDLNSEQVLKMKVLAFISKNINNSATISGTITVTVNGRQYNLLYS